MPIYEYKCQDCDNRFEKLQLSSDKDAPDCPSCDSGDVKRLMSAGFVRAKGIPTGSGGFKAPSCARCN